MLDKGEISAACKECSGNREASHQHESEIRRPDELGRGPWVLQMGVGVVFVMRS